MSEQLASGRNEPTPRLTALYRRWGASGAALLITGNVMVDRRAVSEPRQAAVEEEYQAAFESWAAAATHRGAHAWVQLNHPGRQVPRLLHSRPHGPSPVRMSAPRVLFGTPREMTERQIDEVIRRFAAASRVVVKAGFTGVQVHAAHGYLLSQFLSPAANQRTDRWGGTATGRRRLLLDVVRAVRGSVGATTPVSVKLNSADFLRDGVTTEEAQETALALAEAGVDLLEISGGTFEAPAMLGAGRGRPPAGRREAYFLDFAELVRSRTAMPLMLTGGFRTANAMADAVSCGAVDVVGLGRPLIRRPGLPAHLLSGTQLQADEPVLSAAGPSRSAMLAGASNIAWHTEAMRRMVEGRPLSTRRGYALLRYTVRTVSDSVARRLLR